MMSVLSWLLGLLAVIAFVPVSVFFLQMLEEFAALGRQRASAGGSVGTGP